MQGNFGTLFGSDPTSSSTASLNNYWAGYTANGDSWTTISSTLADPTPAATNAITQRQGNGIAVSAAASSLPGISFTPASSSSVYLVSASFSTEGSLNGTYCVCSLTDGTTPIAQQTYGQGTGLSQSGNITLVGIYVPGTSSPVTLKIQMASPQSGTATITSVSTLTPSIEWSIIQIK
jgi:hypothetical protein